ncbi:M20/M25/M40 family metallo-hydrolase [Sphingobacterium shayense]|nr:M20/M25/M40 family metallo-hydrolase [Sphingobacterium shayense]
MILPIPYRRGIRWIVKYCTHFYTERPMKHKNIFYNFLISLFILATYFSSHAQVADSIEIKRIISTLASDEMRGRATLSPDIAKAADFIAEEFSNAGLQPYTKGNYRQTFQVTKVAQENQSVHIDGRQLSLEEFLFIGYAPSISWTKESGIKELEIKSGENFSERFREIVRSNPEDNIVWVDPSFAPMLARFKKMFPKDNVLPQGESSQATPSKVFVVKPADLKSFTIKGKNSTTNFPLFNVAAVVPGKSKADEYVIFSAHYDHIGVIAPVGQDSIANGADDDASGTTAMISLAKYFKQQSINERTLIFVAFTGEEIGMFGSKYFSNNIDADKVIAMINIEMIGKDSKFGPNSLYVTGYQASNLASLMQDKLKGTSFNFHPDPYPQQNLFYRSDNAVLAALGVPAHTFSTSQIDKDEYYHTVKDEISTLDIKNITSSVEAIAKGVTGIISGEQTPTRVEKLKD